MSAKNVRQSAVKANEKLRQTFEVKPQKQKSTRLQNPSDDEQQLHETEQAVATIIFDLVNFQERQLTIPGLNN